jgi:preflagellin peptidase FlaK
VASGFAEITAVQLAEFAPVLLTLLSFAAGSIYDVRRREVPDRVWLIYGLVGFGLTSYHLYVAPSGLALSVVSILLSAGVAFGLNYFGLFGGADAKAIICLSVTIPLFPQNSAPTLNPVLPFFPLIVIVTGFVLAAFVSLWLGLKNLATYLSRGSPLFDGLRAEPVWKKALAALTGYRTSLSNLQSTFYLYPMEEVTEDSNGARRRFKLFESAAADREELIRKVMVSYSKVGNPELVWVTPGLPMILFFLAALILTIFLADPIFTLIIHP